MRALATLPRPEVILNNWVNAELLSTPRTLDFIAGFADQLGLPVLNHPRKAAETTRQKNAERLAGIPDLVIPRLIRFNHEPQARELAVRAIGEQIGFPVIIRGPFAQKGVGARRQPDRIRQFLIGDAGIGLQLGQDLEVEMIEPYGSIPAEGFRISAMMSISPRRLLSTASPSRGAPCR